MWGRRNDHSSLGFVSVKGHLGADVWETVGNVV